MPKNKKEKTEDKVEEKEESEELEEDVEEDSGEVEEKKEARSKDKDNMVSLTDKFRENPWVVSTLVLGVIIIILLVGNFSMTGGAVGVAKPEDVQAKVLSFVNSQVDEPVEWVSTNFKNGLYEIVVNYQGREIPIYATSDGQNLVQGVTPIDQLMQAAESQDPAQTAQPTAVPKSDKPLVELFVMSMCPYGTQAEKGIIPALEALGDKIDFKLRFVSYAMHGKEEIDQNTVQYCIQKNEPAKSYSYLRCYLEETGSDKWASCLNTAKIDKTKLNTCISAADTEFKINELFNDKSTWSGGSYPQYNVDKELNTQYGVQGSPTLVINGVVSNAGRDSASYLAGICAAFNTAPEECSTALSSTAPAPGFGWEATAAADTAAQCG